MILLYETISLISVMLLNATKCTMYFHVHKSLKLINMMTEPFYLFVVSFLTIHCLTDLESGQQYDFRVLS